MGFHDFDLNRKPIAGAVLLMESKWSFSAIRLSWGVFLVAFCCRFCFLLVRVGLFSCCNLLWVSFLVRYLYTLLWKFGWGLAGLIFRLKELMFVIICCQVCDSLYFLLILISLEGFYRIFIDILVNQRVWCSL